MGSYIERYHYLKNLRTKVRNRYGAQGLPILDRKIQPYATKKRETVCQVLFRQTDRHSYYDPFDAGG